MILDIKYAKTEKTRNGLLTFGVAQQQGGNGTLDVPGGGGKGFVFFKLDHRQVERETWNKKAKNFEKLQRQTTRLYNKLHGFGSADNDHSKNRSTGPQYG